MSNEMIARVVEELLDLYRSDLHSVRQELTETSDTLRRESLLEAQEGLEFVIGAVSSITDAASAYKAGTVLEKRIEGMHPAIIVQIVNHARSAIASEILTPLRSTVPPEQASDAAVRFLRTKIKEGQRSLFLADITKMGLANWAIANHIPLGMTVRNNLRAAGFDESTLGVKSLDGVWADLFYQALLSEE